MGRALTGGVAAAWLLLNIVFAGPAVAANGPQGVCRIRGIGPHEVLFEMTMPGVPPPVHEHRYAAFNSDLSGIPSWYMLPYSDRELHKLHRTHGFQVGPHQAATRVTWQVRPPFSLADGQFYYSRKWHYVAQLTGSSFSANGAMIRAYRVCAVYGAKPQPVSTPGAASTPGAYPGLGLTPQSPGWTSHDAAVLLLVVAVALIAALVAAWRYKWDQHLVYWYHQFRRRRP